MGGGKGVTARFWKVGVRVYFFVLWLTKRLEFWGLA